MLRKMTCSGDIRCEYVAVGLLLQTSAICERGILYKSHLGLRKIMTNGVFGDKRVSGITGRTNANSKARICCDMHLDGIWPHRN